VHKGKVNVPFFPVAQARAPVHKGKVGGNACPTSGFLHENENPLLLPLPAGGEGLGGGVHETPVLRHVRLK
jgi:hypothetical protein